jgi:hypothetical protein
MSEYIDERTLSTSYAKRALDHLIEISSDAALRQWAKHKNSDLSTFSNYLNCRNTSVSRIRNIIYNTIDTDLLKLYVTSSIYVDKKVETYDIFAHYFFNELTELEISQQREAYVTDLAILKYGSLAKAPEAFIELHRKNYFRRRTNASIIVGAAGSGKTFIMRRIFLEVQRSNSKKIPIFLEARNFKDSAEQSLDGIVFEEITRFGDVFIRKQVEEGLSAGLFSIFIDGLDEIQLDKRSLLETEIHRFVDKYQLCPILLSARPSSFSLPQKIFNIIKIKPFSVDDSINMVKALDFDEVKAIEFIEILKSDVFITHEQYICNPLLCTIMFLTFINSGVISRERHEFYEAAFDALWQKHDANKIGVQRERKTKLEKKQFISILSAFCLSAYFESDYDISDAAIEKHLNNANKITGMTIEKRPFIDDLCESISICMQDGDKLRFVHRSIQEYFTAIWLSGAGEKHTWKLSESLLPRSSADSVLFLSFSINKMHLERNWISLRLSSIIRPESNIYWSEYQYASFFDKTGSCGHDLSQQDIDNLFLEFVRKCYDFPQIWDDLCRHYEGMRDLGVNLSTAMVSGSSLAYSFKNDMNLFIYTLQDIERRISISDSVMSLLEISN